MDCCMRILIVLDDPLDQDHERSVTYAAGLLGGREGIEVHLMLVLPPTPSEFLEFGSLDEQRRETAAHAAHQGAHAQWLDTAIAEAHPAMSRARRLLEEAGIPEEAIREHYEPSLHARHVAQHALEVAHQYACDTIALNHGHLAWYQRWLHADPGNQLLRKAEGLTLWFVG